MRRFAFCSSAFLALVLFVGTSCVSPESVECAPSGLTCPGTAECSSDQRPGFAACIYDACGNGVKEGTEACDDGNITAGDGCSATCASNETCGNMVVDGVKDEVCDDGDNDDGDGCSSDCKSNETCGNDITDGAKGEVCDDGANVDGDGCSANCLSDETCGNGIRDNVTPTRPTGEECDDGNPVDEDNCTNGCNDNVCGDGFQDRQGTPGATNCDPSIGLEACDDGNTMDNDGCSADCQSDFSCGNCIRDSGEICDDGNNQSFDGCSADCTSEEQCGNTAIDPGEQCDDGIETQFCDSDCTLPACGDGHENGSRIPAETCDTGGESDICDANCTDVLCGDNTINTSAGEQCDPGTGIDGPSCDSDCTVAFCGDGHPNAARNPSEQCDDGNSSNLDNCRNNCVAAFCGDGLIDGALPFIEACDDGDNVTESACDYGVQSCDLCSADCLTPLDNLVGPFCGDGTRQASFGEACDDGNTTTESVCPYTPSGSCTLCDANCSAELHLTNGPRCGDGITQVGFETCDDGNTTTEAGCPYGQTTCNLCNATCGAAITGPSGGTCGDGTRQALNETCDDGNNTTEPGCPYGQTTCSLCNATCTTAITGPSGGTCGDGTRQVGNEACDDGDAITNTTCPYGQTTCPNACNGTCTALLPGLPSGGVCGDGTRQSTNEACDDGNTADCGTCSANCQLSQSPPAAATGQITPVQESSLRNDGDTFTLNDGEHTLTFEFDQDTDCCGSNGRIRIAVVNNSDRAAVAAKIEEAIDAQDVLNTIDISASLSGTGNSTVVILTNTIAGGTGNKTQSHTVNNGGFAITNMTGGTALDCPLATGCSDVDTCLQNRDAAEPDLVCTANVCSLP